MSLKWTFRVLAILFTVWICLTGHTSAKSVKKGSGHLNKKKDYFTKKCECRIETFEGKILHDFGELEKYNFPETSCHEVHHKCRRSCAAKLDLEGTVGSFKSGYHYCDAYGHSTPKGGVTLVAVWKPKGCPHHREEDSLKEVQLCCGHTTISLEKDKVLKVFGWNKDCKAQTFVIGN